MPSNKAVGANLTVDGDFFFGPTGYRFYRAGDTSNYGFAMTTYHNYYQAPSAGSHYFTSVGFSGNTFIIDNSGNVTVGGSQIQVGPSVAVISPKTSPPTVSQITLSSDPSYTSGSAYIQLNNSTNGGYAYYQATYHQFNAPIQTSEFVYGAGNISLRALSGNINLYDTNANNWLSVATTGLSSPYTGYFNITASILGLGGPSLAANATTGFPYISNIATTPTGTPAGSSGRVATAYDITNDRVWFYNGAWRAVTLGSGGISPVKGGGTGVDGSTTGGPFHLVRQPSTGGAYQTSPIAPSDIQWMEGRPNAIQSSGVTTYVGLMANSGSGTSNAMAHPSGKFVFGFCNTTSKISCYIWNTDGTLTANGSDVSLPLTLVASTAASIMDPLGRFIWIRDTSSGTLRIHTMIINQQTGRVTAGTTFTATVTGTFNAISVSGCGRFLATNYDSATSAVYLINPTTGAVTLAGSAVTGGTGMSLDAKGRYFFTYNSANALIYTYTLDQVTGAPTLASSVASNLTGLIFCDPKGRYVAGLKDTTLTTPVLEVYAVNQNTGGLTLQTTANVPFGTITYAFWDVEGKIIYVSGNSGTTLGSFAVSVAGVPTYISSTASGSSPTALNQGSCHPSGNFIFVASSAANGIHAYSINSVLKTLNLATPSGTFPVQQQPSTKITLTAGTAIAIPGISTTTWRGFVKFGTNGNNGAVSWGEFYLQNSSGTPVATQVSGTTDTQLSGTPASGKWGIQYGGSSITGWSLFNNTTQSIDFFIVHQQPTIL